MKESYMVIEVKLFADFRKGRFNESQVQLPEDSSLSDLLEHLKIPEKEARVLILNGIAATAEQKLSDHDVVAIFPLIAGG